MSLAAVNPWLWLRKRVKLAELARAEFAWMELVQTELVWAELARLGFARTELAWTEQLAGV